ncbi:FKBP-type peptidyl-prolyl cis-trans isomerase [Promicromonospora thailandica]|uniref:peptidylprolyl isomerase n=1 Tax=Promicromonospora thailandica TaxID=765201 RepID=A0A9X2JX55_9MICO|nr:FKBP-type peptidyl-prolyl cis-trans isomerase [Promicromonospora thailandica]MCP2266207.1 peptidylprolyl isomerase [Promicromonospora thailandica]BFF20689.1 FKBP-type peptidyl-prolyl cis-trans isomerase [Promicromonospora thailandica]
MKHRTTAGLAAVALASIALTGCASGDDTAGGTASDANVCEVAPAAEASPAPSPSAADLETVEAIEVSGPVGKAPKVTFKTPLEVSSPASRIVAEGTGDELTEGAQATIDYVVLGGKDGKQTYSTWETKKPESFTLGDPQYDLLNDRLIGQKVGARIAMASTAMDQTVQVTVVEVSGVKQIPTRAEGTEVEPEAGLPAVELAENGQPTVTIPQDYEAPTDLVIQPLIEGDGAKVTRDQTVTVQYAGCLLDGTSFDSSWSRGTPTSFPLNGVISGWTEGIAGQKVGSQVLLVVPADKGYGDQENGAIPANSTLVFVVDILEAKAA